jgi:hypothetical protein
MLYAIPNISFYIIIVSLAAIVGKDIKKARPGTYTKLDWFLCFRFFTTNGVYCSGTQLYVSDQPGKHLLKRKRTVSMLTKGWAYNDERQ